MYVFEGLDKAEIGLAKKVNDCFIGRPTTDVMIVLQALIFMGLNEEAGDDNKAFDELVDNVAHALRVTRLLGRGCSS